MSKTKKIFFPTTEGTVPAFVTNVDDQLTTGGLGTKYGISAGDLAISNDYSKDIPEQINEATAAMNTAKSKNDTKDTSIGNAKQFYNNMGHQMQKNAAYDSADLEAMGFFKETVPPDPNTAKPSVTHITVLSDQVIFDWVKRHWSGVVISGSYDNVTWAHLDKDNRSPYEDKRKNQVVNVPEIRYYKFRYFSDDKEIGLETEVKALTEIY